MEHQSGAFVSILVVSLVAAFTGGLAARSLRLPPLLGYIAAGVLIGPFTPGFVADQAVAADLAEVGVALLLFNIGLHFSVRDLLAVRKVAVFGALVQIFISGSLGAFAALVFLGASPVAALMIGLSVAIASTAISTRVLEERHQLATLAGRVALGWLIVQDIVVIVALVLFPAFSGGADMEPKHLAAKLGQTVLQVAGFAVVMIFGGRRVIPKMLAYVARIGSRELFTLAVIVIALGIAYGSSMVFGVSLALGAFFAGVVIGESDLNHHASSEALSMQQIFTILFFVSVGMLFDPGSIARMPVQIAVFWAIVVAGMGLVTFFLMLFLRVPAEGAALVGGAFAQIGEFSFVLGELGRGWGIIGRNDRDLILAVALVSIVLNPLVMKFFPILGRRIGESKIVSRLLREGEAHLPEPVQPLAGHVILAGHGRVGKIVAQALSAHDIPYIIIESNRRLMEKLRQQNRMVIFGDAGREAVLKAAHPETAKMIILTLPDGPHARRIISLARRINPSLEIIARVHDDAEVGHMERLGVGLAVMSERETALGLSAYALQHYGVDSQTVLETLAGLRHNPQPVTA